MDKDISTEMMKKRDKRARSLGALEIPCISTAPPRLRRSSLQVDVSSLPPSPSYDTMNMNMNMNVSNTYTSILPLPSCRRPQLNYNEIISPIIPHLFLGSSNSASNVTMLTSYKITHIVNCVSHNVINHYPSLFTYMNLSLHDTSQEDIIGHLYPLFTFITNAILQNPNANVFIHCIKGISRSASLVLAYLMYKRKWYEYICLKNHDMSMFNRSLEVSIKYLKECRRIINPIPSFLFQLNEWNIRRPSMSKETSIWMYRIYNSLIFGPLAEKTTEKGYYMILQPTLNMDIIYITTPDDYGLSIVRTVEEKQVIQMLCQHEEWRMHSTSEYLHIEYLDLKSFWNLMEKAIRA